MDNGSYVHKVIENYLKGAAPRLTKEMNPKVFGELYKDLRKKRRFDEDAVSVEDTWAFRSDWSLTRWDDWSGCWLRIKVDCAELDGNPDDLSVTVIDWKTGKFRQQDEDKYTLQLDLYALGALMKFKEAKKITVWPSLVYVDVGERHSVGSYTKDDLPRLKKEWEARVRPMLNDTRFPPKPNGLCRFCTYRAENGGPCKF